MQKVLMIAFHYPPFCGGSGVLRSLKFSQYLPNQNWHPIVLSASPRAYLQTGEDQLYEIPANVVVKRAFAVDTARHLSIGGLYLKWLALPDRWIAWWLGAVPTGLRLIRRYQPAFLWSTYPIATAHLIGLTLHRLTGIPWIADFRDSMTEEEYPRDPVTRQCYRWIETQTVQHSVRLIFTTKSTQEMYLERYPQLRSDRCTVIPNGYDEEDFKDLVPSNPQPPFPFRPIRLLHSGLIYPDDRDPRPFFKALARLKNGGQLNIEKLRVDLRASGSEDYYAAILQELGLTDLVHLLPALPYRQALQDCADADGLLLFQAASCNHQIPAKAYEYLNLRKPILAFTPEQGDTAALLQEVGGATIVDLADEEAIFATLPRFLSALHDGCCPLPDPKKVQRYRRKNQAGDLAYCLSQLAEGNY